MLCTGLQEKKRYEVQTYHRPWKYDIVQSKFVSSESGTLMTCLTSISFRALIQSFSEFAQVIYPSCCTILKHVSQ